MNYPIVVGVAVLVIILIAYLIIRNQKDKKEFEEEVIQSELPPEKDDKENN
jgi:preprotein translocase subunit YajC